VVFRFSDKDHAQKREAERRKAHAIHCPRNLRALPPVGSGADARHGPVTQNFARHIRLRGALAFRRFARGSGHNSHIVAQLQARLPGTWSDAWSERDHAQSAAGVTRPFLSQSSDSTSRPGRSTGGLMPKAARVRLARPRAGAALAPLSGSHL